MAKNKIQTPYTEQAFEKYVDASFKALLTVLSSQRPKKIHMKCLIG
jgi:hypothetical protein